MPTRPDWFTPIVAKFTKNKLPAFFEFAKDKKEEQIEKRNLSFVNKIYSRIPNKPINTRGLKLGKLDYKCMMSNSCILCTKQVSDLYDELNRQYRFMINMKDEHVDNMRYVACSIRDKFSEFGYADETITDMLVEYLYGKNKRHKQLLWFCYGYQIAENLEKNIGIKKTKFVQCVDCGEWFEIDSKNNKTCRCETCQTEYRKEYQRQIMQNRKI